MRPLGFLTSIALFVVACAAAPPAPVVTLARRDPPPHPVASPTPSLETFGVVPADLGMNETRHVGFSKDDAWLGYEISTCDPCPQELHFVSRTGKTMSFSYYYAPGAQYDEEREKQTNADADRKVAELGVATAKDARALRGPFPYPDLHVATKTEQDPRAGTATVFFGANGVFPMKVTLGPMPMFSQAPADEKKDYLLDPMLVYANVTRDGSEIGIVVIARGPMWWEDGGVARMRTADFVAAVRSR